MTRFYFIICFYIGDLIVFDDNSDFIIMYVKRNKYEYTELNYVSYFTFYAA